MLAGSLNGSWGAPGAKQPCLLLPMRHSEIVRDELDRSSQDLKTVIVSARGRDRKRTQEMHLFTGAMTSPRAALSKSSRNVVLDGCALLSGGWLKTPI